MQLQHQAPANHVAQLPIGLYPVPRLTEFGRKCSPTRPRVLGDQLFNKLNVCGINPPTAVAKQLRHEG
jgi:hypothetical protein